MLEADRDRLREFVADVSHELRTPIAALRIYTELQRDGDDRRGDASRVPERSHRADRPAGVDEHQPARPVADRRRHLPARHARRRPARPGPGRGAGDSPRWRVERGIGARLVAPAEPVGHPLRPRADRAADEQPDRQRPEVHATRRAVSVRSRTRPTQRVDRGPRHRPRHPRRTSCPASSIGSTAGPTSARHGPREAAWAWRSCARSWRCTAAASTSASVLGEGHRVPDHPAPPGRVRRPARTRRRSTKLHARADLRAMRDAASIESCPPGEAARSSGTDHMTPTIPEPTIERDPTEPVEVQRYGPAPPRPTPQRSDSWPPRPGRAARRRRRARAAGRRGIAAAFPARRHRPRGRASSPGRPLGGRRRRTSWSSPQPRPPTRCRLRTPPLSATCASTSRAPSSTPSTTSPRPS